MRHGSKGGVQCGNLALALFGALLLSLVSDPASAAGRVALVIGNAGYGISPLANPVRDARAIGKALERLGFEVERVEDASKRQIETALGALAARAESADMAVVFFAGHGTERDGRNYLIPVDAKLARASDLDLQAVNLTTVLDQISGAHKLKLVLLDACRNNVFPLAGTDRALARGLARIEPEDNTLIAYAAKDGTTADDGAGADHSPFTAALLKHIATPGLEIRFLLAEVRDDVLIATSRAQQPHIYGTLGREHIFLAAPAGGLGPGPAGGPTSALGPTSPFAPSAIELGALGGAWRGFYNYKPAVQPVVFDLNVDIDGSSCLGTITEPNTFGDKQAKQLSAFMSCKLDTVQQPARFTFTKMYDGTGGVSHSVEYNGLLSPDGRSITGEWRIGRDTGPFAIYR